VEDVGVLPELGRDLHHDVVLVQRRVRDRDLTLPERVVQRVVDERGRHVQARRRVAVDDERRLEAAVLLIARHVRETGHGAELLHELRRPRGELVEPVALERVLVLRAARPSADAQILHGLEERGRARDRRQPGAEAPDHTVGVEVALIARLQRNEHAPRVLGVAASAASARERDDVVHRRIAADDVDDRGELLAHLLERDVLRRDDRPREPARVLLREEPLRHDDEEPDVHRDRRERHDEHRARMAERPAERALVAARHGAESAGGGPR
jgi:hypothetical protein